MGILAHRHTQTQKWAWLLYRSSLNHLQSLKHFRLPKPSVPSAHTAAVLCDPFTSESDSPAKTDDRMHAGVACWYTVLCLGK